MYQKSIQRIIYNPQKKAKNEKPIQENFSNLNTIFVVTVEDNTHRPRISQKEYFYYRSAEITTKQKIRPKLRKKNFVFDK